MTETTIPSENTEKDLEYNSLLEDTPAAKKARKRLSVRFGAMSGAFYFAQCFTVYMTTFLMSKGWSSASVGSVTFGIVGLVLGFKAFIEVPMLLLLDRIRNKCPLYYLLIASGIFYMIEAFLYSICGNFTQIMLICLLQGTAGGLHIAAGSNYVATLAPENLKATAQTLNASMMSVAGIIGNAAGGIIIGVLGIRIFYRYISYLLLVSIFLYCLTFVFGEKVLKIPRPKIVRHGL